MKFCNSGVRIEYTGSLPPWERGLKYLCPEHHLTGPAAVHRCQEIQERLHKIGQQEFEKTHTREEFRKIFGRSYL